MALNALNNRPPLTWRSSLDTHEVNGQPVIDLKLQGAAIVVDVARIYALAHGIDATNTRQRLEAFARAAGVPDTEWQSWITAFEFLQSQRLRIQMDDSKTSPGGNPNLLVVSGLSIIDQRGLRDALREARQLQQRLELDYHR